MPHLWFESSTAAQLSPDDSPLVPPSDRGFAYGDGLFETIRILDSHPLFLDRHLNRLTTGLASLNLSIPWDTATLTGRCQQLIAANQISNGILRLTITRGSGPRGFDLPIASSPTLIIQTSPSSPHTSLPTLHACPAPWRIDPANPLNRLKSLSALDKVFAKQFAHQHQADDALFLNLNDHLTEATSSNLFIAHQDQILTPSLACGVLPGITRQLLIENAPALSYRIIETEITPAMLTHSTEAWLTNTAAGVRSLTTFNKQPIGSGQPGPLTLAFNNYYIQLCQKDLP